MRRNQLRMRKSRNCCAQPWQLRLTEYAQIDVSAAIENLLLEADGLGLGAVWLGIAPLTERMDAVRDVLQLPENWTPSPSSHAAARRRNVCSRTASKRHGCIIFDRQRDKKEYRFRGEGSLLGFLFLFLEI